MSICRAVARPLVVLVLLTFSGSPVTSCCAMQADARDPGMQDSAGAGSPVATWNTLVDCAGNGLPTGSGTTERGEVVYQQQCEPCHGSRGRGASAEELVGGVGGLAGPYPDRTVGSFWPYAPPLFDYIRRAMPPAAPLSLTNGDVYAVVAYLLALNGILQRDQVLDAASLARVRMPNQSGFNASGRLSTRETAVVECSRSGTANR